MSRRVLYGDIKHKLPNNKEYKKIQRKYSVEDKEYKLSFGASELSPKDFHEIMEEYFKKSLDYNKNMFTEMNAIFSINKDKIKASEFYYKIVYMNLNRVKGKKKNLERELNEKLQKASDSKFITVNNKKICIFNYCKDNVDNIDKEKNFITYSKMNSDEIRRYNELIDRMRAVNKNMKKFIDSFAENKNKNLRFTIKEVLESYVNKESEYLVKCFLELYSYIRKYNYLQDNKLSFYVSSHIKEKREVFKYILLLPENDVKNAINEVLLMILLEKNARTKYCISSSEKWVKTNVQNDRHSQKYPTNTFIKTYLEESTTEKGWQLFEELFNKFELDKFFEIHQCKVYEKGDTVLFKEFNKHYMECFKDYINNMNDIEKELLRFMYRYIKGRIEKTVSTGSKQHWNVEKIKSKMMIALRNKVLERVLYEGKRVSIPSLKEGNFVNEFQKYHAYEELMNEFFIFYSYFNEGILKYVSGSKDKEFFEYCFSSYSYKGPEMILFSDIFSEESYKKIKEQIKNLRNYSIHNNLKKSKELFEKSVEEDNITCILKKLEVTDDKKSESLNTDIIFSGEKDKYKNIIKDVNKLTEKISGQSAKSLYYPSFTKFIRDIKNEITYSKNITDENRKIIENALIYLLKQIYNVMCRKEGFIDEIEELYQKAQQKASKSNDIRSIKKMQKYIYSQFLEKIKEKYHGILEYSNETNILEEIKNRSKKNYDTSYTIHTIKPSLSITLNIEQVFAYMAFFTPSKITAQFMNRCFSTAMWMRTLEVEKKKVNGITEASLLRIAENTKAILNAKNIWDNQLINEIKEIHEFFTLSLQEQKISLIQNLNEKDNCFSEEDLNYIKKEENSNKFVVDAKQYKADGKDSRKLECICNIATKLSKYLDEKEKKYKKYEGTLQSYSKFIKENKKAIINVQKKQNLENTYIQENEESIIFHESIVRAYQLSTFKQIDEVLESIELSPMNALTLQKSQNIEEQNQLHTFLSEHRIQGKHPLVKKMMLQSRAFDEKYKTFFSRNEQYQFYRNIITHNMHIQLNERIVDVHSKWLQWIARLERDLHYVIRGLKSVYENDLKICEKDNFSRPLQIKRKDGEIKIDFKRSSYCVEDEYAERILCYLEVLGFSKVIEEFSKEKEANIRNFIAHLKFLNNEYIFKQSIEEITKTISDLMEYRSRYNNAVYQSVINVFKKEVDIPVLYQYSTDTKEFFQTKKKTQYNFEDSTRMKEVVCTLFNYSREKQTKEV